MTRSTIVIRSNDMDAEPMFLFRNGDGFVHAMGEEVRKAISTKPAEITAKAGVFYYLRSTIHGVEEANRISGDSEYIYEVLTDRMAVYWNRVADGDEGRLI